MKFVNLIKKYLLYIFILLIFIFLIIWCFVLKKEIQLADICAILALVGVVFAIWTYFRNQNQNKKQALLALKNQLNVVCLWASCGDNAYNALNEEEYKKMMIFKWCDPFHVIYNTETTAIETIWSFPGICFLSDKIIKSIANLNQCIENFNNYLDKINAFSNSIDPTVSIKIKKILDRGINPFEECSNLKEEEKEICKRLYDMYTDLHFKLIGDDSVDKLHKQCKELIIVINEEIKLID